MTWIKYIFTKPLFWSDVWSMVCCLRHILEEVESKLMSVFFFFLKALCIWQVFQIILIRGRRINIILNYSERAARRSKYFPKYSIYTNLGEINFFFRCFYVLNFLVIKQGPRYVVQLLKKTFELQCFFWPILPRLASGETWQIISWGCP